MIDLHCHIHPGVDDGPRDDEETLALARALVAAGVQTAAATSHVRPDKGWRNTLPGDAARRQGVSALLARNGIPLTVVAGAEHYIDDEVFGDLDALALQAVPYGDSTWLLVECPYHGPPVDLFGLLYGIRRRGFRVLLAHVERFPYLCDNKDLLDRIVDAGHLVQVNLGALAGVYSRPQQRAAERLLKEGYAAVLAGDCHRAEDVERNIVAGTAVAKRLVGADVVTRLVERNPQLILDNAAATRIWP